MNEKILNKALADFKNRVELLNVDVSRFVFGRGNPDKPRYSFSESRKIDLGTKYIIYLCPMHNLFIVWDYGRHLNVRKKPHTFDTSKEWSQIKCDEHTITFPYYKRLGTKRDAPYEKVYVVDCKDYKDFIINIDSYMSFNEYDINENGRLIDSKMLESEIIDYSKSEERKIYSSQYRQRDYNFRKSVLKAYDYQCAICRCETESVLQAAHLHGYEVTKTDLSADNPKNGICLCANHHLMYDNGDIDIDVKTLSITINKSSIKSEYWYEFFADKNGFNSKILKRRDKE